MIDAGMWSDEQAAELDQELDDQIASAWDKALNDPYPEASATLNRVYASAPE